MTAVAAPSEEKCDIRALFNRGKSLEWRHAFFGVKRRIRIRTTGELSANQARRNCVDANFGSERAGEGFGQREHAGFRRGIGDRASDAGRTCNRCDVYDCGAGLLRRNGTAARTQ